MTEDVTTSTSAYSNIKVGLNSNQLLVQLIWSEFMLVQCFATKPLTWTFIKCELRLVGVSSTLLAQLDLNVDISTDYSEHVDLKALITQSTVVLSAWQKETLWVVMDSYETWMFMPYIPRKQISVGCQTKCLFYDNASSSVGKCMRWEVK